MPTHAGGAEAVKVVVRCRPLNRKEIEDGRQRIVKMDLRIGQLGVSNPKAPQDAPKSFTFDLIYDENVKQIELYNEVIIPRISTDQRHHASCVPFPSRVATHRPRPRATACFPDRATTPPPQVARPVVDSCIEGYNGTVFAYGQTGTGKTHSMEGGTTPELQGIIPNSFDHIFTAIAAQSDERDFLIRASFLEIYNEEIRDLLARDSKGSKLELKENAEGVVYVKDLTNFTVR